MHWSSLIHDESYIDGILLFCYLFVACTGGEMAFQAAINGFLEQHMVLPTSLRHGWLLQHYWPYGCQYGMGFTMTVASDSQ